MSDNLREEFERQRKELTQSLKYASYIQQALLPAGTMLERYFPEHFLLYLPRDIVSGDFYWVTRKRDLIYLAVGDCTGHGVPGAFLSILGISFLNQILTKYDTIEAGSILNILREHLMKALQQTGAEHEQKDGIDMAICVINQEENILQYAGAFNPVYLVKKDCVLLEANADKMPIGIAAESEHPFRNQNFKLEKGDMIYLFSDGYADQFGGKDGKKFKYKPFRELLTRLSSQPVNYQQESLEKTLLDWRGEVPQLDDVTVLGIRYTG